MLKQKWSLGPKNGLERRVWQFYTICDKNQGLKVKTDKVTAILVPRSGVASAENPNLIWALRKSFYGALWSKRTVPAVTKGFEQFRGAMRECVVELDGSDLIRAYRAAACV